MRRMLGAAILAAATAVPAWAGDIPAEYERQLRAQISQADAAARSEGFRRVMGPEMDALGDGASERYTLQLQAGRDYVIHGVCDADCSDLDLKILDENGRMISEDASTDDQPVVTVTPRWTGRFELEVAMFACAEAPCYYAVSVYER